MSDYQWELDAINRWKPNVPPLANGTLEELRVATDREFAARNERAAAHAALLERTARYCAREVAAHRITLGDARKQLDSLASRIDPHFADLAPIRLVSVEEADRIITLALASFEITTAARPNVLDDARALRLAERARGDDQ